MKIYSLTEEIEFFMNSFSQDEIENKTRTNRIKNFFIWFILKLLITSKSFTSNDFNIIDISIFKSKNFNYQL
jgi:hypothetical protein